jgi:hypothetical protein
MREITRYSDIYQCADRYFWFDEAGKPHKFANLDDIRYFLIARGIGMGRIQPCDNKRLSQCCYRGLI